MARRLMWLAVVLAVLGGGGYGLYEWLWTTPQPPPAREPTFDDDTDPLPTPEQFGELARTRPVTMLKQCLKRYTREVKGFTATLEKQERVHGKLHDVEVIRVAVQGDVPESPGARPNVKVQMIWEQGEQKDSLGNLLRGTLYVEGRNKNQILTYRPDALMKEWSIGAKESNARSASRYCIRVTGLYQVTLRTHAAWDRIQKAGQLEFKYDGLRPIEKLNGRPCYVIKRFCPHPEADAFALDEEPPADPKVLERDGFTEVTIFVDAERWVQAGTELRRGADLIGAYYYRDLELNPTFPEGTFTAAALRGGKK
jgi:hypothetical protein